VNDSEHLQAFTAQKTSSELWASYRNIHSAPFSFSNHKFDGFTFQIVFLAAAISNFVNLITALLTEHTYKIPGFHNAHLLSAHLRMPLLRQKIPLFKNAFLSGQTS